MNLAHYIDSLHRELVVAAEAGGSDSVALAERLAAPLESAGRLVLLEALSAAAAEITAELAPASVDVRLRGRDPEFVLTSPSAAAVSDDVPDAGPAPLPDGENTARMTLRLPEPLKQKLDEAAAKDGLSVNAWLVRALNSAVQPVDERRIRRRGPPGGQRYTGWVR